MPFDSSFDDFYKLGVKEPASELDILAERVDEQIYREGILERIYRQIELADIIIADMSGQNPNVFYEVGYAHAKDKICILLTSKAQDIPFDLKHRRHVVYGTSIQSLRSQLIEELRWAKKEIENVRKSKIQVSIKSIYGSLEKSKFYAEVELMIKIDLYNMSEKTSAGIEAIYLYSGPGWILQQDGKSCPSTYSDVNPFKARYFLISPVRKLHKDAWAQINLSAKKIIAWATKGEELQELYRINGRCLIRLVTSEGNFDYELPIDVLAEELPF